MMRASETMTSSALSSASVAALSSSSARTRATSSSGAKGFARKSVTPLSIARSLPEGDASPVIITTGVRRVWARERISVITSNPLRAGKCMSTSTRSGGAAATFSRPSSAEAADSTL
jgi:hypothetical protein